MMKQKLNDEAKTMNDEGYVTCLSLHNLLWLIVIASWEPSAESVRSSQPVDLQPENLKEEWFWLYQIWRLVSS